MARHKQQSQRNPQRRIAEEFPFVFPQNQIDGEQEHREPEIFTHQAHRGDVLERNHCGKSRADSAGLLVHI